MRSTTKNPYSRWRLLMERMHQAADRHIVRTHVKAGRVWICPGCHVALYAHVPACLTHGCNIPRPETKKEH